MPNDVNRFPYISFMQQHNSTLAVLCQHIDIKASIFLSLVSVMLFAYAFGSISNVIILVCAVVFAISCPIRIGVKMLRDKPVQLAGGDLNVSEIFTASPEREDKIQRRIAAYHKKAIEHNTKVLKYKQQQNAHIIFTSLLLFGYMFGMSIVTTAITSPDMLLAPFG